MNPILWISSMALSVCIPILIQVPNENLFSGCSPLSLCRSLPRIVIATMDLEYFSHFTATVLIPPDLQLA
ncbi:hypothetical protein WR25_26210 [Diploscapter pachys]|uniref:Uncharacterized protein n=1 Tax=Diploscapter pachys TaxID=2018661 RepID=A0A2A2LLX7_9BILA|nr:hypothetical protein WR25_26210 [Diploscapter pachys]